MALTKVGKEGITGISNSSDATAITINSSENVGIGTASPTNGKLEVTHSSSTVPAGFFRNTSGSGDSPSLTVQGGANNAASNFSVLDYDGNVDFIIQGNGDLLVGCAALPTTNVPGLGVDLSNNSELRCADSSTGNSTQIRFLNPNGEVGSVRTNGSGTNFNTSSDYRLKENVTADWDATTRLKQLNPVRFNFIADASTTVDGFLAHEVQTVVPEAISGTKDAVDDDGNAIIQAIDQSKIVPLLVKTIQELEARITALESA